ncbi:MAG: phosphatase PAP2 family protein [Acidimicrobiia bacterium]|nr:phosphatase PAP2 family protein [Acidimicrobiia bacterium]
MAPAVPDPITDRVDDRSLGGLLHRRASGFDARVDRVLDRLRGNAASDRVFYAASQLGDFSLIWHVLGSARALRAADPLSDATRSATIIGAESLLVNQGVKRLFDRTRPVHDAPHPHRLRRPSTSSFPSGHASAAFVAAAILSEGSRAAPAYYALAAVVATSRTYVRVHHASDVVAGAVLGCVLGRIAVRVWPRTPAPSG